MCRCCLLIKHDGGVFLDVSVDELILNYINGHVFAMILHMIITHLYVLLYVLYLLRYDCTRFQTALFAVMRFIWAPWAGGLVQRVACYLGLQGWVGRRVTEGDERAGGPGAGWVTIKCSR